MEKKTKLLSRLKDHKAVAITALEKEGLIYGKDYLIEGIYLMGSQNYGTDHENSDVDSFMVIVPTYLTLATKQKLSWSVTTDNNEFVSVKTLQQVINTFFNGSIQYYEILTTDFFIEREKGFIQQLRQTNTLEEIVECTKFKLAKAIEFMMASNFNQLFKNTQRANEFFAFYGYNNVAAGHVVRFHSFLDKLTLDHKSVKENINIQDWNFFNYYQKVKEGKVSKESLEKTLLSFLTEAKEFVTAISTPSCSLKEQTEALKTKLINLSVEYSELYLKERHD